MGLVAAMAVAVFAPGCGPRKQKPSPQAEEKKPEPQLAHIRLSNGDFVLAAPEGGRLWEGKGSAFDWDSAAQTASLKQAVCTFYQGGKAVLRGTAPAVRADYRARVVYLDQGVQAHSPDGAASFRADRAEWRAKEQKVYGRGNVKFVRGQSEATGDRIVADTALKHVRLQGEGRPVVLRIVQTRGKALF
jgi:LPS export ABC transporter protein LptC